ncbi:hypothetical protein FGK60_21765 [Streptomyces sp. DASNCL29]|nr:hypothetical protein FGK60_21765 [Streptomyces sp. DASNCL29]
MRREALVVRVEVEDRHRRPVAAGRLKHASHNAPVSRGLLRVATWGNVIVSGVFAELSHPFIYENDEHGRFVDLGV